MKKDVTVASVERALMVLDAFRPDDAALSLNDIAARTKLYKSTILRLIATLDRKQCILRLADGRYRLGPTLLHWGSVYQRSFRLQEHVVQGLHQLAQQTKESASYYTRQGQMRLCLFRVDSLRSVRDHVHVGDLLPLGRGAAGRVLVDYQTPEQISGQIGVVTSFGERDPETAAVSAPVFGPANALFGALSVSGPLTRFTAQTVGPISRAVLAAAIELTRRCGGEVRQFQEPGPDRKRPLRVIGPKKAGQR